MTISRNSRKRRDESDRRRQVCAIIRPPESASFAGQAGLSHSLAYQNTPKRRLHRFPSQGPQVPAACGETGMAGSDSEPLDRGALGRGGNTVSANLPSTCTPPVRRAVRGGDSGAGGAPRSAGEPAYPM